MESVKVTKYIIETLLSYSEFSEEYFNIINNISSCSICVGKCVLGYNISYLENVENFEDLENLEKNLENAT